MKPTIVYLHGLNCSSKVFSFLQAQLPNHTPFFIDYPSHCSVQESYSYVVNKLPKKPFTIIGHSLGGIIGHLISTRTRLPLKKLVTISTPFGGSGAAGLLRWIYPHFTVLKDLSPTSKLVKELASGNPACPFLSLVSIAGNLPFISAEKNDGVVTIESQVAIPATKRLEINANHLEALLDMNTVQAVKDFMF